MKRVIVAKTEKEDEFLVGRIGQRRRYNFLLDACQEVLPFGHDMWNAVAQKCKKECGDSGWSRHEDACKKKFKKLAFMKVPTGSTEMLAEVELAKIF